VARSGSGDRCGPACRLTFLSGEGLEQFAVLGYDEGIPDRFQRGAPLVLGQHVARIESVAGRPEGQARRSLLLDDSRGKIDGKGTPERFLGVRSCPLLPEYLFVTPYEGVVSHHRDGACAAIASHPGEEGAMPSHREERPQHVCS
jgi:hypothetical protein